MKWAARQAQISLPSGKYQIGCLLRTHTLHIADEWKSLHETCERENINQAQGQLVLQCGMHHVIQRTMEDYQQTWHQYFLALKWQSLNDKRNPMQYGTQWFITLFTRTHCFYVA